MSIQTKNVFGDFTKNKILVFLLVAILAIQNLIFQITFRINFPYSVDFTDIFTPMFDFIVHEKFTFFINKGIHVMFFPKLISLPNLYLNSFDVVNLTYLYWIVMSLTVFVIYLIIKQTDKRLIWTLIPISAFIYNPLTTSGYFMLVMLEWYFPLLSIVSIIYLFNKKTIKTKIFTSSVGLAIFSTFSILLGVVSWIAGITMLLKSISEKKLQNKKLLFLWIFSSVIIGFFYMQLTSGLSEPTRLDLLFSFTGFSFIANFLASSFRLKYDILMLLAGSFSIIISIFYIWYFIKKDYLKQYFPWFALLFTAFCGSIITALGRMHLNDHFGNEPYYSTISQLLQIGLIILTGKLILEFRESPKIFKKKFLVSILISIIIFQIIFLIPSYYSGWQRGEYYFDEKTEYVNCFLSSPELHCLEKYHTYPTNDLSMINYLITNNLSIFGETDFIQKNEFVSKNFYSKVLPYSTEYSNIIKLVNGKNPPNSSTYNLNEEFIEINGSFIVETNSIPEKLYLLLDKKPIFSTNNFEIIQNYDDFENKVKINWSTFFLSGYVKNGCHSINLVGHTDDTELILSSDFEICKTK